MTQTMILWGVSALALIGAEMLAPGVFLLWLGLAAGAVFFLVWAFPGMPPLAQAVAFAVLSLVSIGVYLKFFRTAGLHTDRPQLNKRGHQLIGQVLPLHEAIVNGHGRVKWGDALWTVEGPDLPAGTAVRVVGAYSMSLKVQPA